MPLVANARQDTFGVIGDVLSTRLAVPLCLHFGRIAVSQQGRWRLHARDRRNDCAAFRSLALGINAGASLGHHNGNRNIGRRGDDELAGSDLIGGGALSGC
jgi:hypothetical protein